MSGVWCYWYHVLGCMGRPWEGQRPTCCGNVWWACWRGKCKSGDRLCIILVQIGQHSRPGNSGTLGRNGLAGTDGDD